MAAQNVTFKKRIDNGLNNYGLGVLEIDSGYIMLGRGKPENTQNIINIKLFKTNINGNIIGFKEYGALDEIWEPGFGNSATTTYDGNYAVAGVRAASTTQHGLLIKFDVNLDTLWTKVFPSANGLLFYQCRETIDSCLILIGAGSDNDPNNDILLLKTDRFGNELWRKEYGGPFRDIGWTVELTPDGGFIIGGDSYQDGTLNTRSGIIIKVDSTGNVEWDKLIGSGLDDGVFNVNLASDNGYLVWGNLDTLNRQVPMAYVSKLDFEGNLIWRRLFFLHETAFITQSTELANGNILAVGSVRFDTLPGPFAWLVLHDSGGNKLWEKYYYWNIDTLLGMRINDFIETSDGGILVTGAADKLESDGAIREQFLLMKLDSNGCLVNDCGLFTGIEEYLPPTTLQAKLYPNPTTGTLTIELPSGQGGSMALYNLLGQSIYQTTLSGGQTTLTLNLPPGLYLYRIGSGGKAVNGKLLVE
jgi:hypothetical protein